ncbi:hypothetical protein QF048_001380 [Streptomyces sp. W4I9-2]|nr:hypothetical protein [Streptomyces sp. W4I9-2]
MKKRQAAKKRPVTAEASPVRAPFAHAGGRLHEDRLTGARGDTADHAAGAVDEQRLGQARHTALVVGELGLGADADDGGHRVEEAGQHQGEDDHPDRHHPDVSPAAELDVPEEREVGGGDRAALQLRRAAAPRLGVDVDDRVDDDRDHGADGDADEDRAGDVARLEHEDEQQGHAEDEDGPAGEFTGRAEGDGGRLALVDESGLVEADEGDEEPDAHGDAVLERERDRVHDHLAEAGDHQEADHHTVDHTHAHGLRPGHVGRDLRGEHAGDAEAGGERQGHLPDEAHEQGRRGRREGGRGDQAGLAEEVAVDVLPAQDQRVEQQDVRHGHEGRDAAAQLARDGGSPFGYVEVPVEP